MRCLKFWFRGALLLRPIPYFNDYDCWSAGRAFSCTAIFAAIPVAIFLAGVYAGRHF